MPGTVARGLDAVDNAINAEAETAFSFLERLIRARSTVGEEAAAQGVVAAELARLGFEVATVPVPEQTSAHPAAGVPQCSYAGRDNVLGRLNPGGSPAPPGRQPHRASPARPPGASMVSDYSLSSGRVHVVQLVHLG